MLAAFFENTVYVRVKRNQLRVRHVVTGKEVSLKAPTPFSTNRLLIGQFTVAENLPRQAMREIFGTRMLFMPRPHVVIQPLEMLDAELSEVERRVLTEVAVGAGAAKVLVWVGPELNDEEVKLKIKAERAPVS